MNIEKALFVCPIKIHEPMTDLPQILNGELGRNTRLFLVSRQSWVSKLEWI